MNESYDDDDADNCNIAEIHDAQTTKMYDVCAGCSQQIDLPAYATLRCGHLFHYDCIRFLLHTSKCSICPMCSQTEFNDDDDSVVMYAETGEDDYDDELGTSCPVCGQECTQFCDEDVIPITGIPPHADNATKCSRGCGTSAHLRCLRLSEMEVLFFPWMCVHCIRNEISRSHIPPRCDPHNLMFAIRNGSLMIYRANPLEGRSSSESDSSISSISYELPPYNHDFGIHQNLENARNAAMEFAAAAAARGELAESESTGFDWNQIFPIPPHFQRFAHLATSTASAIDLSSSSSSSAAASKTYHQFATSNLFDEFLQMVSSLSSSSLSSASASDHQFATQSSGEFSPMASSSPSSTNSEFIPASAIDFSSSSANDFDHQLSEDLQREMKREFHSYGTEEQASVSETDSK